MIGGLRRRCASPDSGDGVADRVADGRPGSGVWRRAAGRVRAGAGDDHVQPYRADRAGPAAAPCSVAVGDFDRDGKPDLAIANGSGNKGERAAQHRQRHLPLPRSTRSATGPVLHIGRGGGPERRWQARPRRRGHQRRQRERDVQPGRRHLRRRKIATGEVPDSGVARTWTATASPTSPPRTAAPKRERAAQQRQRRVPAVASGHRQPPHFGRRRWTSTATAP